MKRPLSVVGVLTLLFMACEPPATKPTLLESLQPLATASDGPLSVELLTKGPLAVGQNRVFYRVKEHDALAAHAELTQKPLMKMMTMQHGCPVVNPDHMAGEEGLYEGLVIFTMASTEQEPWSLQLEALLSHDGVRQMVDFGAVTVADSANKKVITTADGKKLILTFGFPEAPVVGANEVLVTAHVATDMMKMNYATVDDLELTLVTEMPSMGHGANGNVAPTRGEDGLYRGTAVFSMAGDWVVHLGVKNTAGADLGTFDFALDL